MKSKILAILVVPLLLIVAGCGQSLTTAKTAYTRGTQVNQDVRHAMFVKAWGLNRAVITEARLKWCNEAIIAVLKAQTEGKVSADGAEKIIRKFQDEIGQDEVVASQNFAYLAFMLMAGERADEELGNVDFYLGAQEPIWKAGSHELQGTSKDVAKEIEAWKLLLPDLKKALPPDMLKSLGLVVTTGPA